MRSLQTTAGAGRSVPAASSASLPGATSPLAAAASSTAPEVAELSDLVDKYDAFLLDQFGVLHDGEEAYPGSADAVRALQRAGKRIVILSNSSKRRRDTVNRLQSLGMGMCTWLDSGCIGEGEDKVELITVQTSGDIAHQGLAAAVRGDVQEDVFKGLAHKSKVFVFGNGDEDETYLESAGLIPSSMEEADFILARGLFTALDGSKEGGDTDVFNASMAARINPPEGEGEEEEGGGSADALLRVAADRGLPMIVSNPDLVRPDADSSPMPGVLGARYGSDVFGGDVRYIGKPHSLIYDSTLSALLNWLRESDPDGPFPDLNRVAAIGDSMHHDVLGARRAGIDAVFVAGGCSRLRAGG